MDSRLRGNDKQKQKEWIPAFAGMTRKKEKGKEKEWIPACAGMTRKKKTEKERKKKNMDGTSTRRLGKMPTLRPCYAWATGCVAGL